MPTGKRADIGKITEEKPTGYLRIKTKDGWRRLHRVIMEKHIGRKLREDEQIDHHNGNKKDNRIKNLKIMSNSDHQRKGYHIQKFGIAIYNERKGRERAEWAMKNEKKCESCGKKMDFMDLKYYFYKRSTFKKLKKCSYGCKKKN